MACQLPPRAPRLPCLTGFAALCITLGLVVAATGCGVPKVSLSEGAREYVATDYDRVLDHWTRNSELIVMRELDNVLNVTATYEAWDFRWAYVVRYASDYRLSVDQRRVLLERTLSESREHHQFYIALFAENHKWADLTRDDPAWVVRMVDDQGNETPPREIIPIERPGAVERTYFPYTTPWRRAFRLRFPTRRPDGGLTISPEAKYFGLRFAGAQGNQQLVWEIEQR
ncbi:MAG: hypothetical protein KIT72_17650 [Polyangiaceae bacterium]|nr:hypothetical protein [Polyangiaceae bacterium]MCW5792240.1 hypothetical protein [Polyangiaceae bacterium]